MTWLFDHLRNLYSADSLDWFDVSYAGDWIIATSLWFVAGCIHRFNVFEREFSVDDPLINHPHMKQQISGFTNNALALLLPFGIMLVHTLMSRSLLDLHHGALGLWVSRSLSHLMTEFLKNRVGRLRPDFLARCKWGEALKLCTGKFDVIIDGRKSFPSGHSSTAFSGMTFLFLWLSARTGAWAFGSALPTRSPWVVTSRLGRMLITLLPLLFASWVAISRVEDYRHHKEDVIVGALIGILCGNIGYLAYWPNPFSTRLHAQGAAGIPRLLYRHDSNDFNTRNNTVTSNNYELAQLEEGHV